MEKVVVIGCRDVTADLIRALQYEGLVVDTIITISEECAKKNHVPKWCDLVREFRHVSKTIVLEDYTMKNDEIVALLSTMNFDVGFCIGWQRLIPKYFLDRCRNGIFGTHASDCKLPSGQGRSPINWSLINGAEELYIHIFKYVEEADAGELCSVPNIDVHPSDDIDTLQKKVCYYFTQTIINAWELFVGEGVETTPLEPKQDSDVIFLKRKPEDGKIDWTKYCNRIYDFVRAQTRPYPGAFTTINGRQYRIWKCVPCYHSPEIEGEGWIIFSYSDGSYLVNTGKGSVLITDSELPKGLPIGKKLGT